MIWLIVLDNGNVLDVLYLDFIKAQYYLQTCSLRKELVEEFCIGPEIDWRGDGKW